MLLKLFTAAALAAYFLVVGFDRPSYATTDQICCLVVALNDTPAIISGQPVLVETPIDTPEAVFSNDRSSQGLAQVRELLHVGGHGRFDYYSASKRLDNIHSLPGLTVQPTASLKLTSWADAKFEGRLTQEDLRGRQSAQARFLEGYINLFFGSVDFRIGKQNIVWGRADALSPNDVLTPKDFTLLSARDEEERRTGTVAIKANYYSGQYTVSVIWLPVFNPSTVPITIPSDVRLTEDKRSHGSWSDQGFGIKLDKTGGEIDWSVSYYHGLDVLPVGRPISASHVALVHNRLNVFGTDFSRNFGPYGVRGELAYVHTQDGSGGSLFVKNPFLMYVFGADRNITDDINLNLQFYQKFIVNFHDPFRIQDPVERTVAVLNDTLSQQLDRFQGGFTGRLKASWWNKTLDLEILAILNLPRKDFFFRPSIAYALTDTWKVFVGWDIFNGQRDSFFGRLQPMTGAFVEVRYTF